MADPRQVELIYTNWRGETRVRRIVPMTLWWGSTEWHPEPQWLITGLDADTNELRDFSLAHFKGTPTFIGESSNGRTSDWTNEAE